MEAGFERPNWWSIEEEAYFRTFAVLATNERQYQIIRAQLRKDLESFIAAVAEADEGGAISYSYRGEYYTYAKSERRADAINQLWLTPVLAGDLVAVVGAPWAMRVDAEAMIFESWVRSSVPIPEVPLLPEVPREIGALNSAGQVADRGGLTKAGRALAKHGGREGSAFPRATGSPTAVNQQGQVVLDEILGSVSSTKPNRFGGTDYIGAGGRGARYDAAGNFMGFLEP